MSLPDFADWLNSSGNKLSMLEGGNITQLITKKYLITILVEKILCNFAQLVYLLKKSPNVISICLKYFMILRQSSDQEAICMFKYTMRICL